MRTEKVVAVLFVLAFISKFMRWPGAEVILILSAFLLACMYFPLGFYFFCDKTIKNQNLILSIASGFFLAFSFIGVIFKLMYWTGDQVEVGFGACSALILVGVTYYLRSRAKEELGVYYKNMLIRTTTLCLVASFFYLIPRKTLIEVQYRNEPELARLKVQAYCNPENEVYYRELDAYIKQQDSLRSYK